MRLLNVLSSFCLAAGVSLAAPALAAPVVSAPVYEGGLVVQVRGCHSDVRRHYVPEYGRRLTHRHRRNCAPVHIRPLYHPRDCHRDIRRHHIPGYRGHVAHRHIGPRCIARIYR